MTTADYIKSLDSRYRTGHATEHTFRGDLQNLIESLAPGIQATNEPKRQACGAPDYILTKKNIPVGYIEAKDIGDADLTGAKKTGNKEQFDRYKGSLDNLIFTDYLDFYYYKNGEFATSVKIGVLDGGKILPLPHNYPAFELLVQEFTTHIGQTIKSPKRLAEMMAGKARMLANVIENSLNSDVENQENSTLKEQMNAFKEILIHDITPKEFSDVYAQTIAYGMFAARLYDESLDSFSRQEAAELIPKSNPFLRKLFQYIAGYDLDDRITWIVDALADIFRAADVNAILKNFGKATKMEDPIIHFYEDFLSSYDPKLRKARGVWYTPHPVVNFIIRAVDDILIDEFGLPMGLADTSKTTIKVPIPTHDKRFSGGMREIEQEVHRVQFLDPATGTGTFVAEAINQIYSKMKGQQGLWNSYVENHLLPRINGFELLMASYAMAHLKLDLLLKQTGYTGTKGQRFRIYLTNSLEEYHKDTGTLFANWLSAEANEANQIKRDAPVMIVAGNPPYSVSSTNKGAWIESLVADYKKNLNERNIQPLSDDYIKFIRYGQHFIEKNGSGILAYISNNSFIDGIIHRQMRNELSETFDKIYILDLHGNAKKKETSLDGSKDENVFDIQQGVSINIFIKNQKIGNIKNSNVLNFDLRGLRSIKYEFLNKKKLSDISWNEISPISPNYFFVKKDFHLEEEIKYFKVENLFNHYNSGLTTEFDEFAIQDSYKICEEILRDLKEKSIDEIQKEHLLEVKKIQKIINSKNDILKNEGKIKEILYRPFDKKHTIYTGKSNGLMGRPRYDLMKHFLNPNIGLIIGRQGQAVGSMQWNVITITNTFVDSNVFYRGRGTVFPLYLYPDSDNQLSLDSKVTRTPNLDMKIVKQIADGLGLSFVPEKSETSPDGRGDSVSFAPIDLLDYIYAVLHSPTYREKYKEFLKIDFPRVPYPDNVEKYWKLVKLGGELRALHLMECPSLNDYITEYPIGGDNEVEKPVFVIAREERPKQSVSDNEITSDKPDLPGFENLEGLGRVYINSEQYFDKVPEVAWNFYIGGYQPAQKWLKDRKGRTLEFEDILHYQKIIKALTETERVMGEIDGVDYNKPQS